MVLNSYAKLNLYLEVLSKRKDSYHNIKTIFERIDLCDKIVLKVRKDKKINLISHSPGLPRDSSRNLAYRSAELLQTRLNLDKGVDIQIIKRIPVAAGLGGGSSNAATVLMGLDKLWRLNLSREKLLKNGIKATVINMHTIRPLDSEVILKYARLTRGIVVCEEHTVIGGLSSSIHEVVAASCPVKIISVGIKNRFGQSGEPADLLKEYNLTCEDIEKAALSIIA